MPATKSDLLDRYLQAVKFWLPKKQQQDILAELAEDLHSQIEEREAAFAHPVGEDDLAAILKKRGAPMKVASGYLHNQRLIDPAILPIYRLVLKIVLFWMLASLVPVISVGLLATSARPASVILGAIFEMLRTGFMVVGIVTAVFVLFDHCHVKIGGADNWDPRKLPRVPSPHETSVRGNYLAGAIFGALGAFLWMYFMWRRSEFAFPGGIHVILGPAWKYTYGPVLVLTLINASADAIAFLYPCWARVRSQVRIGVDVCMLVLAAILLEIGNWVELVSNLPPDQFEKLRAWVNLGIEITLIGVVIGSVIEVINEIRALRRAKAVRPAQVLSML